MLSRSVSQGSAKRTLVESTPKRICPGNLEDTAASGGGCVRREQCTTYVPVFSDDIGGVTSGCTHTHTHTTDYKKTYIKTSTATTSKRT